LTFQANHLAPFLFTRELARRNDGAGGAYFDGFTKGAKVNPQADEPDFAARLWLDETEWAEVRRSLPRGARPVLTRRGRSPDEGIRS
jgi:hypothetical protein